MDSLLLAIALVALLQVFLVGGFLGVRKVSRTVARKQESRRAWAAYERSGRTY